MRVTNNMMSQNLLRNLETSQEKMLQLQNQASSSLKINKPSDDPAGAQKVLRLKSNISSIEQWKSNADEALSYMNTVDSTLGDMTSMLQRVKDLAVQGSSETQTVSDRTAIASEVDELAKQLKLVANTQIGSKYIFSGTATDKELIPASGDMSESQANEELITLEMGKNVSIPISVNGLALFGDSETGVFATLNKLKDALTSNNTEDINATFDDLDTNINNVINQRTDLGARNNRVTAMQNQLDSTSFNLQKTLSNIQSADLAQTITEYTNQQTTYKAALSVGSQIIQLSLVDYLN